MTGTIKFSVGHPVLYEAGDLVACYGTNAASRFISAITAQPTAPGGLRWGPSHVAIVCKYRDRDLWVESTTMCDHPCEIQCEPVDGVQAHIPQNRIADYVSSGGRVDVYRLVGLNKLSEAESKLLTQIVLRHLLGRRRAYDLRGALISGTRLLRLIPGAKLEDLFCSELVAAVLMRLGRMNHSNPARYHPARLLRELVRTGVYRRVDFSRPDRSRRWSADFQAGSENIMC